MFSEKLAGRLQRELQAPRSIFVRYFLDAVKQIAGQNFFDDKFCQSTTSVVP
jgi:hypothetical protein